MVPSSETFYTAICVLPTPYVQHLAHPEYPEMPATEFRAIIRYQVVSWTSFAMNQLIR